MFTGLIEEVGRLTARRALAQGVRLRITAPRLASGTTLGASVSVQGACQTVVALGQDWFEVDAVGATLAKSTLGNLGVGAGLNLERALRADQRLDGHLVAGHVQGVGTVKRFVPVGDAWLLEVELPRELRRYTLSEGSIALDGVSLTIAGVTPLGVTVSVIPHTRAETTLKDLKPASRVNIETDGAVRAAFAANEPSGLTWDDLNSWGYS
ncbi:MAG: riboflavin synthase [Spirochaetales bacterium]|nr:riboflavin synthase [Spirochaetales bacterium]